MESCQKNLPPEQWFNRPQALVPNRLLHLDLKGLPPTFPRLLVILEQLAVARYTGVLVEWEDMFPWTVNPHLRSPDAYSPQELVQFADRAATLGLEIVPLVQSLGHLENVLRLPEYAHLRAVPTVLSDLDATREEGCELIWSLVEDVLRVFPHTRRFCLGGDEASQLLAPPTAAAFAARHGKAELYLRHMTPLLTRLGERGIRPLLWHDMMIEWDDDALRRLGTLTDLAAWGYTGVPESTPHHFSLTILARFKNAAVNLWGCGAFRGADACDGDLPNIANRAENALGWARAAEQLGFTGLIATGWARYSTFSTLCEPVDVDLHTLLLLGEIFYDGQDTPATAPTTCQTWAAAVDPERFPPLFAAQTHLAACRQELWFLFRSGWHNAHAAAASPIPGREDDPAGRYLPQIREAFTRFETALAASQAALAGLVSPAAITEYGQTRRLPTVAMIAQLSATLPL